MKITLPMITKSAFTEEIYGSVMVKPGAVHTLMTLNTCLVRRVSGDKNMASLWVGDISPSDNTGIWGTDNVMMNNNILGGNSLRLVPMFGSTSTHQEEKANDVSHQ